MKKDSLTIGSILPLICVRQAKNKLAPTKHAAQGSGLGTIIVYRHWSLGNSPDHLCLRILVVSGPGHPRPTTDANPSRSETDAGDTFHVTVQDLCVTGYTKKVRNVPAEMKREVYEEYGVTSHGSGDYEVDHLIPLELGGSNSIKNLWPESHRTSPWNAQVKDRLEGKLHELVCSGQLDLKTAQQAIAADWIGAYKFYVSPNPPARGLLRPPLRSHR